MLIKGFGKLSSSVILVRARFM